MANDILLEAGTNEMEMLEFRLGDTYFGINVAKVREITQRIETIKIPHSPPSVDGSFQLRDSVLALIDLSKHFGMECQEVSEGKGAIIIVVYNNIHCGILVDAVEQIHRLSWSSIEQPSSYLANMDAPITGTVNIKDKTVLVIDCETIIGEILGVNCIDASDYADSDEVEKDVHILFADDSSLVRKTVIKALNKNGYNNITVCNDGVQAWNAIENARDGEGEMFDLVLTDIEMPGMDGLHLTSKVKQDPKLKNIPVVLFSSLITYDNRKKGESVGANAQVSKTDSKGLLKVIEDCVSEKSNVESDAEAVAAVS